MNLKIDFDSSLKDFEANSQAAYSALDDKSNNIVQIIYSGLQLTSCLSFDLDIDSYCELHSICLIYFGNLRKALSDKSRFNKDKLNIAFEISLSCRCVLPRLYLALLIACTTKNKEQLKLISEMLLAVSHPLRGLLLRFTAISFFPKCPELADLLVDFAVTNFKEMLFLLSGFLKIYPKSKQLACQWLTSNTTISLFLSDNNPNIVKSFFDFAKACKENYVSIAIVDSISQSIEGPQIPKYFDLFADFFKTKAREETAKMKRNKILQANKMRGNTNINSNQKTTQPTNQQKNIKSSTETSPIQTTPNTNTNQISNPPQPTPNPTKNSPPPPQSSSQAQLQPQRPNTNTNSNPPPQQKQPPPPPQPQQKGQIQPNRFQPSSVAMPPMGRVALPPMRPMSSVALPPVTVSVSQPQNQPQPPTTEEPKKDEEAVDADADNEANHDSQENVDGEPDADGSSELSNAEEDTNEEDENDDQSDQKSDADTKTESPHDEAKPSNDEDEVSKPPTEGIKLVQSLSDSSLIPELKPTVTANQPPNSTQLDSQTQPQTAQTATTTATSTSNVPIQITSSLSSPSLHSANQTKPPQPPQRKPPQKRQKQRRQQANTLYNATKHIAIACLEKCDNAREGFRFIQMTPFSESCGLEVTRLALRMNDIEVVKMCASRWMKQSVHHEILTKLGYKVFAEIVPPELPKGSEITKEFIQKVTENSESDASDSISLRKILTSELEDRSIELNGYINELVITHSNYEESFYSTLFSDPYRFTDFLQISTVVSRYTTSFIPKASSEEKKESMKKTVLGFLDRTRIDIQNLISLRCDVYENDEKGDDLVKKCIESIEDSIKNFIEYNININANNVSSLNANLAAGENSGTDAFGFDSNLSLTNDKTTSSSLVVCQSKEQIEEKASAARRILISNLSRLSVSESSLNLLYDQCVSFISGKGFRPKSSEYNEIIGLILLSATKGNEMLTEKALISMLNMDLNTIKVSDQILLYFEALNVIISVTENEKSCLISMDTTKRLLDQIIEIINELDNFKKFFPIITPVQSNFLLKIAEIAKQKKHFAEFEDAFNSIIESLKNC